MSTTTPVLIIVFLVYLGGVSYLYGRQGRWLGLAGWALFMGGMLLASGGAGDTFPWAGLLWSVTGLFGLVMVAVDVAAVRRNRRS